jgi:2-polyprenyl-6-methoxyphenol hydroxylase-like FAD-dependent oxidoreductase
MITQPKYDAIVVGARVAGAGMAAFLSRAGFRVLLIDRVHFPKPALSCPLYFGNTLDMLNRLGALPRIEAIGAPTIRLYQTNLDDIHLRGRMLPYRGYDYAYSIRREVFDAALFEHVAGLPNVETRLGFNITGLLWGNDRVVGVKGRAGGGAEEEIRANVVVGADGIHSLVAQATDAAKYHVMPPRTCVYYAYYSHVEYAGNEPSAAIYYDHKTPVAFITSDSDADLTVISCSLPAARFQAVRHDANNVHSLFGRHVPELTARLRSAVRETPMYGVSPRESYYRTPFGPGWLLVGDAGYYKDPITGQGLHDALRAAELAANAYAEYRAGGDFIRVMRRFQETRDRETRGMYTLTDFYANIEREISPQEFDLFRAMSEMPHWSNRYVSLFNGVTDAGEFTKTRTLLRIYWEWQGRKLWQRVTGRRALASAGASV